MARKGGMARLLKSGTKKSGGKLKTSSVMIGAKGGKAVKQR